MLAGQRKSIDWGEIPESPSPDALYLTALLGYSRPGWSHVPAAYYPGPEKAKPPRGLAAKERGRLISAYRKLDGQKMVDAVYAGVQSGMVKPEEIVGLPKSEGPRNECALGLYLVGSEQWRRWDHKAAVNVLDQVVPLISRPELKKAVEERLTSARKELQRRRD